MVIILIVGDMEVKPTKLLQLKSPQTFFFLDRFLLWLFKVESIIDSYAATPNPLLPYPDSDTRTSRLRFPYGYSPTVRPPQPFPDT